MNRNRLLSTVLMLACAVIACPSVASAQVTQLAGGYFLGSFPTGDWGKIAGFGFGVDATDIVRPKPNKAFSIRNSLGLLYNFSRTADVPSGNVGQNDKLSIETKNWSVLFGIGPELSAPNKDVTPFIYGTAGFDTYWTKSELAGTANGAPYSAQHGDSRITFAWSAGLGVRRHVTKGELVELSAEYRSGLIHDYLLPADVHVTASGVQAERSRRASDQIVVRIGTLLGD
jgi:opacity protein-like surface antigen